MILVDDWSNNEGIGYILTLQIQNYETSNVVKVGLVDFVMPSIVFLFVKTLIISLDTKTELFCRFRPLPLLPPGNHGADLRQHSHRHHDRVVRPAGGNMRLPDDVC